MPEHLSTAEFFSRIPERYKDIVDPEVGLSLRQMEELCAEMETAIAEIERAGTPPSNDSAETARTRRPRPK